MNKSDIVGRIIELVERDKVNGEELEKETEVLDISSTLPFEVSSLPFKTRRRKKGKNLKEWEKNSGR
jgi:hypothetical protein